MRYIALFLGSFVLVFAGTYLYVTRIEYPRKYESSISPAGSAQVATGTDSILGHNALRDTTSSKAAEGPVQASKGPEETMAIKSVSPADAIPTHRTSVPQKVEAPRVSFFKLAKLYGVMRPQDAASTLSKLDNDVVVGILLKMEERRAAKVLAAMGPDRAADLTARMLAIKKGM
ncbi:MAG TPA: hypothetical protein EYP17_07205 [Candidatus Latescibacteria bacterium]|nr:hypothetical protein [Candidatus Latescibacterota bacterium]